jgi:hypothetical protein
MTSVIVVIASAGGNTDLQANLLPERFWNVFSQSVTYLLVGAV